jgi:hypothetical protein
VHRPIRFPHPGRAGNNNVLSASDPITTGKSKNDGFVDASGSLVVDIFHAAIDFQFYPFVKAVHPSPFFPCPKQIYEKGRAFFSWLEATLGMLIS